MKKVMVHSLPHLCLFAVKEIFSGTELRYDYGVKDLPWRKKHSKVCLLAFDVMKRYVNDVHCIVLV